MGEEIGAGVPMWLAGREWHGSFFQMRHFPRVFHFDASGLWCYPALIEYQGEMCWFHMMLPAEPLKDRPRLMLFAPACTSITPVNSVVLLEYRDLRRRRDLAGVGGTSPVGRYPWRGIGQMSMREFAEAETDLMVFYADAAEEFADTKTLPPDFIAAYNRIAHPVFLRYLKTFAPAFVKALNR